MKNKRTIINLIFFALPIVDSINGYMVRTRGYYGVGSIYHLFFVIIILLLAYGKRRIKIGNYEKIVLILVLGAFVSVLGNSMFYEIQSISIERIEKIICTFLSIAALMTMLKNRIITREIIENIVRIQCVMVPSITLIADLLDIANHTYQTSEVGKIGFYTGSNEPVAVLTMLGGIMLVELSEKIELWKLFVFFETLVCLIFVQSKLGYLMTAILLVSCLIIFLQRLIKRGKIKPSHLFIGLIIITVGIFAGKEILQQTIDSFLQRQAYQKKYLGAYGFIHYISSGRTLRIQTLFKPLFEGNIIYIIFKLVLGQGARFGYSEILEMDYFDVFLYGGILMLVCTILVTFMIFKNHEKNNRALFEVMILILIYSFVGGHVWTGGVAGIYLALLVVYSKAKNNQSKRDGK